MSSPPSHDVGDDHTAENDTGGNVVEVNHVWRRFTLPRESLFAKPAELVAVRDVSFSVAPREVLGIVGESGSGKSTLSRLIVGLDKPDEGDITVAGRAVSELNHRNELEFRRDVQIVLQDPLSSLDPRMNVRSALLEPLRALSIEEDHDARVRELLDAVQLPAGAMTKYPHEFSGGQRQRIAIARALAPRPAVLVADEPVSALDLSVQAQILNLLLDLRDDFGLTVLIVAHDLGVVHHMSDRVVVMKTGEVVETGSADAVFGDPQHPYTRRLLDSIINMEDYIPTVDGGAGP